jgi:hypothetical protein
LLAVLQLAPKEIREMTNFRRFCAAVLLAFAVAFSTYAGEIPCGVTETPPPSSTSQATTTGDMSTMVTGEMSTGVAATDPVTEIAVSLLQSVLSLF